MADRQSESWVFHCGNTLEASGLWDCFHCVPDTGETVEETDLGYGWVFVRYPTKGNKRIHRHVLMVWIIYPLDTPKVWWNYQRSSLCCSAWMEKKTVMNVQPLFLPTLPSCRTFPPQGRGWHWKDLSLIKKINSSFPKFLHLLVIHLVCCKRKM